MSAHLPFLSLFLILAAGQVRTLFTLMPTIMCHLLHSHSVGCKHTDTETRQRPELKRMNVWSRQRPEIGFPPYFQSIAVVSHRTWTMRIPVCSRTLTICKPDYVGKFWLLELLFVRHRLLHSAACEWFWAANYSCNFLTNITDHSLSFKDTKAMNRIRLIKKISRVIKGHPTALIT